LQKARNELLENGDARRERERERERERDHTFVYIQEHYIIFGLYMLTFHPHKLCVA
jgi:hypothetical protein